MEILILSFLLLLIAGVIFVIYKLSVSQNGMPTDLRYKIENIPSEVSRIESSVKQEITSNRSETSEASKQTREELSCTLRNFGEQISTSMKDTSSLQKSQLETFSTNQS